MISPANRRLLSSGNDRLFLMRSAYSYQQDEYWMTHALTLAHKAQEQGEVPVGAVLVYAGEVIGEGWNQPIAQSDPTAHAEIIALREAGQKLGNYRWAGSTLYVTLEPCVMCMGAIVHARVQRLVFGAFDEKAGAATSRLALAETDFLNHRVQWQGGVRREECQQLLADFFLARR